MKNKRFISIVLIVLAVSCLFGACKSDNVVEIPMGEETTVSDEGIFETTQSTTNADDVVFYDRLGEAHTSLYELPYYTEDGRVFYYEKANGKTQFVDSNKKGYDVDRCYINAKGYFVYDEAGEIALDDTALAATDKKGRKYYPAVTIRWTRDQYMSPMFGVGKPVKQLDDNVEY